MEDTPPEAHPMPPALLRANFSLALAAEGCPAVLVPTHTHLTAAENHKQTHRPLAVTHTRPSNFAPFLSVFIEAVCNPPRFINMLCSTYKFLWTRSSKTSDTIWELQYNRTQWVCMCPPTYKTRKHVGTNKTRRSDKRGAWISVNDHKISPQRLNHTSHGPKI